MDLQDVKLKEISIFLDVIRIGSVRELARQRKTNPGQISKIISSLERKLGFKLIERSPHGVKLTAQAKEIYPIYQQMNNSHELFRSHFIANENPQLSFATTSFFSTHFLPGIFSSMEKKYPKQKLRLLDLSPDLLIPVAHRNGFQVGLHLNELEWPQTWTSQKIGHLQWILCARKSHPALAQPQLKTIFKYPFVFPVYWSQEGISYGSDNFPMTEDRRIRGIETSTAASAIEIIGLTDHLGFVPELAARPLLDRGKIEQIHLSSLKVVKQSVYLTIKSDLVPQSLFNWLTEKCTIALQTP